MSINLGDKAKDAISGFSGIVTGVFRYLNGCVRIQLDPDKLDKDGKVIDGRVFDVEQITLVKAKARPVLSPTGGPMDTPSRPSAPAR